MLEVESNRVEYKQELNDKFEKEVVGFLNYREGGIIYLGVDDNGKVLGLENIDEIQLKISERIKNNILPATLGLFDIEVEKIGSKSVVKVIIASGPEKPYYIKRVGMTPKGCYLRVGSATQPLILSEIDRLYSKRVRNSLKKVTSDKQDLTFRQLNIYYDSAGYSVNERFLDSLGLKTSDNKYNYVAYLLSDENGASIKVAKYKGIDRVDLLENNEYGYCCLLKATDKVIDKLDIENKTMTKVTGAARRFEKKLVDETALREAVINAIIHNDWTNEIPPKFEIFSDRIEVTSAGGLVPGMSEIDMFEGVSAPRNIELMRVFKDLEYVEQLGSGIGRILKVYDKSIYKISENFIRVIFKFSKEAINRGEKNDTANDTVNDTVNGTRNKKAKVLEELEKNPNTTASEISKNTGYSVSTTKRYISKLKEENTIERIGSDKTGYWKVKK